MATLITCTFPSIHDITFKVDIDDSSFGGAATEVDAASDGFTLTYQGDGKDPLSPILGSNLAFTVATMTGAESLLESFADDLIDSAEGRFTIAVYRDSGGGEELYWCGYVLPDLSGFEDHHPPYGFKIVATDGLGRLKGIEYNDGSTPAEPNGVETFLDHILNCLNEGELSALYFGASDVFLKTSVNWVDGRIGAPTAAVCPLTYARGDGKVFAERRNNDDVLEWKFDSCYEVLKKICCDWQCRILFSDGTYRVEQISERSQELFYERSFSTDGTLQASTASGNEDVAIAQTGDEHRLSGGNFNYLAAAKKITAVYEHKTAKNQLTGTGGKWNIDSPQGDTVTIDSISTDADTALIIRGRIRVVATLDGSYSTPWRYVFKMLVSKGGDYLTSGTAAQQSNGQYLPIVVQDPYTWESSLNHYELSSDFCFGDTLNQEIPFYIYVEDVPTSGTSIDIQFTTEDALKITGAPELATLSDWRVLNPALIIISSADANSWIELDREYYSDNPDTGNSLTIEKKLTFGYAVRPWTLPKIETYNGSAWADSGVSWDQDATGSLQFGELWVREAMALRRKPIGTYTGSFWSETYAAHSRATLPDLTAYLMMSSTFASREMVWQGKWVRAGYDRATVTTGTTDSGGEDVTRTELPTKYPTLPVTISPTTNSPGIKALSDIAIAALSINYVGTTVTAGTITSIDLDLAAPAGTFVEDDDIFILNPTSGELWTFTIATTNTQGATSISVDSQVTTTDIPAGAYMLYSPLNRHTTAGGSVPVATLGNILIGNGAKWIATGVANDDYVLVGTIASGWAEGQVATGGIEAGAVTNVKLADMKANSIKANINPVSFDPQDIDETDLTTEATPASGMYVPIWNATGLLRKADIGNLPSSGPSGSGAANHIAIWTGASTLSHDASDLYYNPSTEKMGIRTGSPSGALHIAENNDTFTNALVVDGSVSGSGSMASLFKNNNTTGGNAFIQIATGGTSAGDPLIKFSVTGGETWSVGSDNSDSDKLKIKSAATPSSSPSNSGLTITNDTQAKVGINNDTPAYDLDVDGNTRSVAFYNTNTAAGVSFGAGAGTGPTTDSILGGENCIYWAFTTGTSPTANGTIATITPSSAFPSFIIPVGPSAGNAQTATDITKFYVSSAGNSSFVLTANGTLSASTAYVLRFYLGGY